MFDTVDYAHYFLASVSTDAVDRYLSCCPCAQVMIVATEDYQIPEGQQVKPGSRKMRRKEIYQPRALTAAK